MHPNSKIALNILALLHGWRHTVTQPAFFWIQVYIHTNGVNSSHMNECYKSCIFIEIYGLKLKDLIGNRFMNCLWCGSGLCSRPSFMRVVRRTVNCSVSKNIFNDDKHVSDTL